MAQFHTALPAGVAAEEKFARACQALGRDWHVFFCVEWQQSNRDGNLERNSEIDAVLYHPEVGILLVEVKGGGVHRHGDRWTSIDRHGHGHSIKSPVEQVRHSAHFLVRRIKEIAFAGHEHYPQVAWAVCFPDVDRPRQEFLGFDLERHQILDRTRLDRLEDATREILRRSTPNYAPHRLSDALHREILALFQPSFTLLPSLNTTLLDEREQLLRATAHQQAIVRAARRCPRLLVAGCAGSGKTSLAAYLARLWRDEGRRVLYLCFNRLLSEHLAGRPDMRGVDIVTFHEMARRRLEHGGVACAEEIGEAWEESVPGLLAAVPPPAEEERYDAIVVDEGQDFSPAWWDAVQGSLLDPRDGQIAIFHDPHQNLFRRETRFPEGMAMLELPFSVRCTRSIAAWIGEHAGETMECDELCPEGEAPIVRTWRNPSEQEDMLSEDLSRLEREGLSPEQILVVTCHAREHSGLRGAETDPRLHWASPPDSIDPRRVNLASVHRTKGLEADIVVLADVSDETPRAWLYTGASRARHRLLVYARHGRLPGEAAAP